MMAERRLSKFKRRACGGVYSLMSVEDDEKKLLCELFGGDIFGKGWSHELEEELVHLILSKLKPSIRSLIKPCSLFPFLKHKYILTKMEEEQLYSTTYDSTQQASLLVEFLMKKGLSGLAALYLALYASTQDEKSSPPSHYQLLMKFKETVYSEMGTNMEYEFLDRKSVQEELDMELDIQEAVKKLESIALPPATTMSLAANLSLTPLELEAATLPGDLGGVVRLWFGRKEMWELVRVLVYTKGLGRYTTLLSCDQESYCVPSDIFILFGCLSTVECCKIATYLGYEQETLDQIVKQYPGNTAQLVAHFLKLWRLPRCQHNFLPILHNLMALAGVVEEKAHRRTPAENTDHDVYMNKVLKTDANGAPHKTLDPCFYVSRIPDVDVMDDLCVSRKPELDNLPCGSDFSLLHCSQSVDGKQFFTHMQDHSLSKKIHHNSTEMSRSEHYSNWEVNRNESIFPHDCFKEEDVFQEAGNEVGGSNLCQLAGNPSEGKSEWKSLTHLIEMENKEVFHQRDCFLVEESTPLGVVLHTNAKGSDTSNDFYNDIEHALFDMNVIAEHVTIFNDFNASLDVEMGVLPDMKSGGSAAVQNTFVTILPSPATIGEPGHFSDSFSKSNPMALMSMKKNLAPVGECNEDFNQATSPLAIDDVKSEKLSSIDRGSERNDEDITLENTDVSNDADAETEEGRKGHSSEISCSAVSLSASSAAIVGRECYTVIKPNKSTHVRIEKNNDEVFEFSKCSLADSVPSDFFDDDDKSDNLNNFDSDSEHGDDVKETNSKIFGADLEDEMYNELPGKISGCVITLSPIPTTIGKKGDDNLGHFAQSCSEHDIVSTIPPLPASLDREKDEDVSLFANVFSERNNVGEHRISAHVKEKDEILHPWNGDIFASVSKLNERVAVKDTNDLVAANLDEMPVPIGVPLALLQDDNEEGDNLEDFGDNEYEKDPNVSDDADSKAYDDDKIPGKGAVLGNVVTISPSRSPVLGPFGNSLSEQAIAVSVMERSVSAHVRTEKQKDEVFNPGNSLLADGNKGGDNLNNFDRNSENGKDVRSTDAFEAHTDDVMTELHGGTSGSVVTTCISPPVTEDKENEVDRSRLFSGLSEHNVVNERKVSTPAGREDWREDISNRSSNPLAGTTPLVVKLHNDDDDEGCKNLNIFDGHSEHGENLEFTNFDVNSDDEMIEFPGRTFDSVVALLAPMTDPVQFANGQVLVTENINDEFFDQIQSPLAEDEDDDERSCNISYCEHDETSTVNILLSESVIKLRNRSPVSPSSLSIYREENGKCLNQCIDNLSEQNVATERLALTSVETHQKKGVFFDQSSSYVALDLRSGNANNSDNNGEQDLEDKKVAMTPHVNHSGAVDSQDLVTNPPIKACSTVAALGGDLVATSPSPAIEKNLKGLDDSNVFELDNDQYLLEGIAPKERRVGENEEAEFLGKESPLPLCYPVNEESDIEAVDPKERSVGEDEEPELLSKENPLPLCYSVSEESDMVRLINSLSGSDIDSHSRQTSPPIVYGESESYPVQNKSSDGVHGSIHSPHAYHLSLPPPVCSHFLSRGDGVQGVVLTLSRNSSVLSVESNEANSTSACIDQTELMNRDLKMSQKDGSVERLSIGILDSILSPDVFSEIESENNLSANDDSECMEGSSSGVSWRSFRWDVSFSGKESDAYSGSVVAAAKRRQKGLKTGKLPPSGSAPQRKQLKRKPRKKESAGAKLTESSGSSDGVDDVLELEYKSEVAGVIVAKILTTPHEGSVSTTASAFWEAPLITDVDGRSLSLIGRPSGKVTMAKFKLQPGQELCSKDLVAAIEEPEGLDFVRALIASGVNVNNPTASGTYPLHLAIVSGNVDIVLAILKQCMVNQICQETGKSALHYACDMKDLTMVQVLILNGADMSAVDSSGMTVLHLKSTLESPDIIEYLLLNKMDVNIAQECGATPLCGAIYNYSNCGLSVIKLLLDRGADVHVSWMNVEKNIALTPLCLAAMLKHEEVVSLLVGYGATINVTNETMYPPVAFAMMGKSRKLVEYFTNLEQFDCSLMGLLIPFCIGVQRKHYDCVELLVKKYKGELSAMLRDSKKAGLQRLTDFIYEYKSYLAAPPPPPTSQPEPQPSVIQTTLNPSWSHKNDRSAVPFDSKASRLPAGGVSTVSSSGQAAAATDGVMSSISFQSDTLDKDNFPLLEILELFATFTIKAAVGFGNDGHELLFQKARMQGHLHLTNFFVKYFFSDDEYPHCGEFLNDFFNLGQPTPFCFLFSTRLVDRGYFESILVEKKMVDFPDQLTVVMNQLSRTELPYDGRALLNFLFSLEYGVTVPEPFRGIFQMINRQKQLFGTTSAGVVGGSAVDMGGGGGSTTFSGSVADENVGGGASNRSGSWALSGPGTDVGGGGGAGSRDGTRTFVGGEGRTSGTNAFIGSGNALGGESGGVSRLTAGIGGGPGASTVSKGGSTMGIIPCASVGGRPDFVSVDGGPDTRVDSEGGSPMGACASLSSESGLTLGGGPGASMGGGHGTREVSSAMGGGPGACMYGEGGTTVGCGSSVVSEEGSSMRGRPGANGISKCGSTVGGESGARVVSEYGSTLCGVSGDGGSTMGGVVLGASVISEGVSTMGGGRVGDARSSGGGANGSSGGGANGSSGGGANGSSGGGANGSSGGGANGSDGILDVKLDGVNNVNGGGATGVRNDCGISVGGGHGSGVGSEPGASVDGRLTAGMINGPGASINGGTGCSELNAGVGGGSCTSVNDGPGANVVCESVASSHVEHAIDISCMQSGAYGGGRSGLWVCHQPPTFQSHLLSTTPSSVVSGILGSSCVSGGGDVGVGGVMSADREGGRSLINHHSSLQPSRAHISSASTMLSSEAGGAYGLYSLKDTGFQFIQTKNADDARRKMRTCYSEKYQVMEWNGAKLVAMNVDWTKKKEMENAEEEDGTHSSSIVSNIKRLKQTSRKKNQPSKISMPSKTIPRTVSSNSVPARRLPVVPCGKLRKATPVSALHTERVASVSIQKAQSFGMTKTSFSSMESKAGVRSGSRQKGVGSPASRSKVVRGVNKTMDESVRRGEMSALSDYMVKGVPTADDHRLKHFFEFVDSVPAIKPDDNTKFFEFLVLDAEIQKSWRMIARYLMISDRDIDEINRTSFFVEEKCMRVLQTWRKNDLSADYVEVVYAVINTKGYNPAREARPNIPLGSFDSRTQQSTRLVSVPLETELLAELEKELTREKEKGMHEAEVILQGNHRSKLAKAMVFRLLTLDRDGLRMVEYACKGAAADNVKEVTLTMNYLNITN